MIDASEGEKNTVDGDSLGKALSQSAASTRLFAISLVVIGLAFVVGLLSLAGAHKATVSLAANKPEQVGDVLLAKIGTVKAQVKQQYDVYLNKINEPGILSGSQKFNQLYKLAVTSEQDYLAFINVYQQIDYEVASRVKGSGEWHFYHSKGVEALVASASKREAALAKYLNVE